MNCEKRVASGRREGGLKRANAYIMNCFFYYLFCARLKRGRRVEKPNKQTTKKELIKLELVMYNIIKIIV